MPRALLLVTALLLTLACGDGDGDEEPTASTTTVEEEAEDGPGGDPLIEPEVISSEGGVLTATLTAAPAEIEVAGETFTSNVYDESYIPPVLHAQPGDLVQIDVINEIGPADIEITEPEHTNVHYHGMQVTPIPPGDSVFIDIAPDAAYEYEWEIPDDHPAGLNWYHPHFHGETEAQVLSGLSGMLIIGDILAEYYPGLEGAPNHTMLLKDIDLPGSKEGDPKTKTINGQLDPVVTAEPGTWQVWQIGNVGADAYFDFAVEDAQIAVIERDGQALPQAEYVQSVFLPPASRAAIAIQAGPGDHAIISQAVDTGPAGDPNPEVELGTLSVSGDADDAPPPAEPLDAPTGDVLDPAEVAAMEITGERTITFSENAAGDEFYIDGKQFDPNRLDTQIEPGAVEQWTLVNTTQEKHAFHIHQTEFLVQEVNGVPVPTPDMRDVIDMPVGPAGEPTTVTVLIPFTDPVIDGGTFVYHCHILEHEDAGMMATARVGPPAPGDGLGTLDHHDD